MKQQPTILVIGPLELEVLSKVFVAKANVSYAKAPPVAVIPCNIDPTVNLTIVSDDELRWLHTITHSIAEKLQNSIIFPGWTEDTVKAFHDKIEAVLQQRQLLVTSTPVSKALTETANASIVDKPAYTLDTILTEFAETPTVVKHRHVLIVDDKLNGVTTTVEGHNHQVVAGFVQAALEHTHEVISSVKTE